MSYRTKLIAARKALGMTQEELEALAGVSQGTISQTERGASVPGAEVALRLCRALGISLEDLLHQEPESIGEPSAPVQS